MDAYAWTILHDMLDGFKSGVVGTVGPHDATMTAADILASPDRRDFRMLDGDGNKIYYGALIGGDGFEPLDDFGEPNAGATEIQYLGPKGWEPL